MFKVTVVSKGKRRVVLACKVCGQPITDPTRANVLYSPIMRNQDVPNVLGAIHDECETTETDLMHWWKLDDFLRSFAAAGQAR